MSQVINQTKHLLVADMRVLSIPKEGVRHVGGKVEHLFHVLVVSVLICFRMQRYSVLAKMGESDRSLNRAGDTN